jgi:hypothetical protein
MKCSILPTYDAQASHTFSVYNFSGFGRDDFSVGLS